MIITTVLDNLKSHDFVSHIAKLPFSDPEMFQASFSEVVEFINQLVQYPHRIREIFELTNTVVFGVYLLSIAIKCSTNQCLRFIQIVWPLVYPKTDNRYSEMLQNLVTLEIQESIETENYGRISKILQIDPKVPARNIQILISKTENGISGYMHTLQEVKQSQVMLTDQSDSTEKQELTRKLQELSTQVSTKILELSDVLKTLKEYSHRNNLQMKYIDEFHKNFCDNLVIKKAIDITKHTLSFTIQTLKTNFEPNLLDTLNYETATRTLSLSYVSSKYIETLKPDVGGFEFNLGWVNDISNYLQSLSIPDFFTMLSFIDNSGVCAVCTTPQIFEYYPYFWQLQEMIPEISNLQSNSQKYKWIVEHPEYLSTGLISEATDKYIKRVSEIIQRAPMLDHDIVVWSGDINEFMQCTGAADCTSTTVVQCCLNPYSAIHNLSGERVLKRIRVPRRTHAMYTMNLYSNVIDIVLPVGTKFKITEQKTITVQPDVLTTLQGAMCTTGVVMQMTELEVVL